MAKGDKTTPESDRWATRLVHLNAGWRYFVFERYPGERDLGAFGTLEEARAAIARAVASDRAAIAKTTGGQP